MVKDPSAWFGGANGKLRGLRKRYRIINLPRLLNCLGFGDAYSYVIILPQRYIEPLRLEKGWRAGFGLYVHDKDTGEKSNPASPEKGVSISTKKGLHCDYRPDLWPIMVLGE